jgi:RNA-directed DNA polymerase
MESPLRLTALGGFGEGNEETHLPKGGKVRFVPTLRGGRLETQVKLCAGRLPYFVAAFEQQEEAERFYRDLPERLGKFGLELSKAKTRVIEIERDRLSGGSRFEFLGFEFYWGRDRQGRPHLKRRTARNRLWAPLVRFALWCRQVRHWDLRDLFRALNAKLRGYYNYYGVVGNYESLAMFFRHVLRILFKWLNRRSQLRSYNWQGFVELLKHYRVEKPRIVPTSR